MESKPSIGSEPVQSTKDVGKDVTNALWIDVLNFIYAELFGKEMVDFARTFDAGVVSIEIKPTDRIIDVRLEPYELLWARLNDGVAAYIKANRPEMISREVTIKSSFVGLLGKLWWEVITFNHPKELFAKNLTVCKGYKIIENDSPQNPLEAIIRRMRGE